MFLQWFYSVSAVLKSVKSAKFNSVCYKMAGGRQCSKCKQNHEGVTGKNCTFTNINPDEPPPSEGTSNTTDNHITTDLLPQQYKLDNAWMFINSMNESWFNNISTKSIFKHFISIVHFDTK